MTRRRYLVPGILGLAVGCVTPVAPPRRFMAAAAPERRLEKSYVLGVQKTVGAGEPVARVKDFRIQVQFPDVIRLRQRVMFTTDKGHVLLAPSVALAYVGPITIADSSYIMYSYAYDDQGSGAIFYLTPERETAGFLYIRDSPSYPTGMARILGTKPLGFKFPVITRTEVVKGTDDACFEWTFSGKDAQGIHILQTDYTLETLPRALSHQDLTFPADAVAFSVKNIQFKVVACSEKSLTYTVISD
jgi:hypothetical protein